MDKKLKEFINIDCGYKVYNPKTTTNIKSSKGPRSKNTLYNVCWYIDGIKKETLATNVLYGVGMGIKTTKSKSTHKSGIIILEPQR